MSQQKDPGPERINEEPVPTTTTQPHPPGAQPGTQTGNHSKQQEDAQMAGSNPQTPKQGPTHTGQPKNPGQEGSPKHGGAPHTPQTGKPGHNDAQEKARKESNK